MLRYLANYTHRVAIANSRLRALDEAKGTVSFAYRDYADGSRSKTCELSGVEFIRRFCGTYSRAASPKSATTARWGTIAKSKPSRRRGWSALASHRQNIADAAGFATSAPARAGEVRALRR